jgi:hypothetical protein
MKRYSVSLTIREMHIKTIHFTTTREASMKENIRSIDKDVKKVEPPYVDDGNVK